MATVIVSGIVLLVVALVIRSMIKDKKSGKHSCGGNCASCRGCHH
ncbi:MAG: FeoB-associated Cys-rich membrane protein [Clostridiales bacterium]|nr:FeoB-associated Cys-rich membrane protein [Clostridiales bacterium]